MSRRWTEEEIEFLKCNYRSLTNMELSEKLNKSEKGITWQAYMFNLKKSPLTLSRAKKKIKVDIIEAYVQEYEGSV